MKNFLNLHFLFFCVFLLNYPSFASDPNTKNDLEATTSQYSDVKSCLKLARHIEDNWRGKSLQEIHILRPGREKSEKEMSYRIYPLTAACVKTLKETDYQQEFLAVSDLALKILKKHSPIDYKKTLLKKSKKPICGTLLNFLYPTGTLKPSQNCIYAGDDSMRAREVTADGIIVFSINGSRRNPRYIFLHKHNLADSEIADNEPILKGFFEYKGVVTYQGETFRSFSRVR